MSEGYFKELAVADHNDTHPAPRTSLSQRVDQTTHNPNVINTAPDTPTLLPIDGQLDTPTYAGQYNHPPQPVDPLWDLRPQANPNSNPRPTYGGADRQPSPQPSPDPDRFATRGAEDKARQDARREIIWYERVDYIFPNLPRYLNSPIVRARANDLLRLCRETSRDIADEMGSLMHGARINAGNLREFFYRQEYGSKIRRQLLRVVRAMKRQEQAELILEPGDRIPSRTAIMPRPDMSTHFTQSDDTLIEPVSAFFKSGERWLGQQKGISPDMHNILNRIVAVENPDILDAAICAQLEDTSRATVISSRPLSQEVTQPISGKNSINPLEAIDEYKKYNNAQYGFFLDAANPEKRKNMTDREKMLWDMIPKPIQQYLEWRVKNILQDK